MKTQGIYHTIADAKAGKVVVLLKHTQVGSEVVYQAGRKHSLALEILADLEGRKVQLNPMTWKWRIMFSRDEEDRTSFVAHDFP